MRETATYMYWPSWSSKNLPISAVAKNPYARRPPSDINYWCGAFHNHRSSSRGLSSFEPKRNRPWRKRNNNGGPAPWLRTLSDGGGGCSKETATRAADRNILRARRRTRTSKTHRARAGTGTGEGPESNLQEETTLTGATDRASDKDREDTRTRLPRDTTARRAGEAPTRSARILSLSKTLNLRHVLDFRRV